MAELTEIPAIVMEISDETAEEMAITENLQRKDVTPIEEAKRLSKAHRQRSPRCAILDRAVRQDGSIYPYTT